MSENAFGRKTTNLGPHPISPALPLFVVKPGAGERETEVREGVGKKGIDAQSG